MVSSDCCVMEGTNRRAAVRRTSLCVCEAFSRDGRTASNVDTIPCCPGLNKKGREQRFAFQSLFPNLSKCEQATASSCCQSQSWEADCVPMPFPPWWVTSSVYGNKLFIPYITSYPIYKDHVCGGGLFQITSNSIFFNDTSLVGILPKDKRLTEILRNLTLYSVVLF